MEKNFLKIVVTIILIIGIITVPTINIALDQQKANEQQQIIENTEVTISPLDKEVVGSAGVNGAIVQKPIEIYVYSTDILKVRREPSTEESNVVGLIPAGAEMLWLEDVDDMWSKVKINNIEYFICKDYITTIVPEQVVSILNIEPTHEGIYFVNKSSGEEVNNPNYVSLGEFRLTA